MNFRKKPILSCLVFTALCVVPLKAQTEEAPQVGFFRLVNLVVAGKGLVDFSLDEASLNPKGYDTGQKTGGIGKLEGRYELVVSKQGCVAGKVMIDVVEGKTETFVAYAEPEIRDSDEVVRWVIKIISLRAKPPSEKYSVTLMNLCRKKEILVGVAKNQEKPMISTLKKKVAKCLPLNGIEEGFVVTLDNQILKELHPDDEGDCVVIIYEDSQGNKLAVDFYNTTFSLAR